MANPTQGTNEDSLRYIRGLEHCVVRSVPLELLQPNEGRVFVPRVECILSLVTDDPILKDSRSTDGDVSTGRFREFLPFHVIHRINFDVLSERVCVTLEVIESRVPEDDVLSWVVTYLDIQPDNRDGDIDVTSIIEGELNIGFCVVVPSHVVHFTVDLFEDVLRHDHGRGRRG